MKNEMWWQERKKERDGLRMSDNDGYEGGG